MDWILVSWTIGEHNQLLELFNCLTTKSINDTRSQGNIAQIDSRSADPKMLGSVGIHLLGRLRQ